MDAPRTVTRLLQAWRQGDRQAFDQAVESIEQELRRIAGRLLRKERAGHTLDSVALVNEAYVRFVEEQQVEVGDRVQFLALAARKMRHVLVDYARMRGAEKRGGAATRVSLDNDRDGVEPVDVDLLALDQALDRLEVQDPRACGVIELRAFGGLSVEEVAEAMEIGTATVKRDTAFATAWLHRELTRT